jgi:hypothetical protein
MDNEQAIRDMLTSMNNVRTYASYLTICRDEIEEEADNLRQQFCKALVKYGLVLEYAKIERLKEFIENLESDLAKIGDEFKDVEDVIKKYRLYIFEKEGERNDYGDYWFNTPDGNFSGRISYDEDDDRYYIGHELQIYDTYSADWVWCYDRNTDVCKRIE